MDADGGRASFEHDGMGRLLSVTDPRGNEPGADARRYTTRFAYDPAGALTRRRDPLGRPAFFEYDRFGAPRTPGRREGARHDLPVRPCGAS